MGHLRKRDHHLLKTTRHHLALTCGGSTPTGVCCVVGVSCFLATEADCIASGGDYLGDDTTCDPDPCTGACCASDGTCTMKTKAECDAAGGTWLGSDKTCTPNLCPQPDCHWCLTTGFPHHIAVTVPEEMTSYSPTVTIPVGTYILAWVSGYGGCAIYKYDVGDIHLSAQIYATSISITWQSRCGWSDNADFTDVCIPVSGSTGNGTAYPGVYFVTYPVPALYYLTS